jgi:hypothetical protein
VNGSYYICQLLPTSCFEMVQAANVSVYEPQATSTQHAFCSSCGVHIFHFDHAVPDTVAVNVYCVDNDNLEDVKVRRLPFLPICLPLFDSF